MPPTETGLLINSPELARTKLAMAEAMKKIDPIMFSQAIHHGKERGQAEAPQRENGEEAGHEEQRRSVKSGRQTAGPARVPLHCARGLPEVLMLKNSVPGNCAMAVVASCGRR